MKPDGWTVLRNSRRYQIEFGDCLVPTFYVVKPGSGDVGLVAAIPLRAIQTRSEE